jgi:hypothetical protein
LFNASVSCNEIHASLGLGKRLLAVGGVSAAAADPDFAGYLAQIDVTAPKLRSYYSIHAAVLGASDVFLAEAFEARDQRTAGTALSIQHNLAESAGGITPCVLRLLNAATAAVVAACRRSLDVKLDGGDAAAAGHSHNKMESTLTQQKKLAHSRKVGMKNRLESMLEECYRLAVQVWVLQTVVTTQTVDTRTQGNVTLLDCMLGIHTNKYM